MLKRDFARAKIQNISEIRKCYMENGKKYHYSFAAAIVQSYCSHTLACF
jgi:hypothetical protein